MYTHDYQILTAGTPANEAKGALIMIHGRGATASGIIDLAGHLCADGLAIYAPQATNHSWYPYSFMAPIEQNQPALDSALQVLGALVQQIVNNGISSDKIYFTGFSQGACLALEYTARNATTYGGIVAFTGGLIGKVLATDRYKGNFNNTPAFISTGDPDPHVPLERVEESISVFESLQAKIYSKVYPGRPHTILPQEIRMANQYIFRGKEETENPGV